MTRLIMLDFDGVLRTGRLNFTLDPVCVAYMHILLAKGSPGIVVSSSWRGLTIGPNADVASNLGHLRPYNGITPRRENRGEHTEAEQACRLLLE
jgi:hypothetical protein